MAAARGREATSIAELGIGGQAQMDEQRSHVVDAGP